MCWRKFSTPPPLCLASLVLFVFVCMSRRSHCLCVFRNPPRFLHIHNNCNNNHHNRNNVWANFSRFDSIFFVLNRLVEMHSASVHCVKWLLCKSAGCDKMSKTKIAPKKGARKKKQDCRIASVVVGIFCFSFARQTIQTKSPWCVGFFSSQLLLGKSSNMLPNHSLCVCFVMHRCYAQATTLIAGIVFFVVNTELDVTL